MSNNVSIIGTVGVPAAYGGFETLVENLLDYAASEALPLQLTVYCSGNAGISTYKGASLRYVNVGANGISSIVYDVISIFSSIWKNDSIIILLGVSGAIVLPLVRLISKVRIITNVDGVEWKRAKWGRLAKLFLRVSEFLAVKFSHQVIADNRGIAEHVLAEYSVKCAVIGYGGDHAINVDPKEIPVELPNNFSLSLCRIEPENNVEMILTAFAAMENFNLVFIGNWKASSFGVSMFEKFSMVPNIHLLDPIYDLGVLRSIRSKAAFYVHGHSAGGTNPSLVEMMHFGIPVFAFDCIFNRYTTDDKAQFFSDADSLRSNLIELDDDQLLLVGSSLKNVAIKKYTWKVIGKQYFDLLCY